MDAVLLGCHLTQFCPVKSFVWRPCVGVIRTSEVAGERGRKPVVEGQVGTPGTGCEVLDT